MHWSKALGEESGMPLGAADHAFTVPLHDDSDLHIPLSFEEGGVPKGRGLRAASFWNSMPLSLAKRKYVVAMAYKRAARISVPNVLKAAPRFPILGISNRFIA